MSPPPDVWVLRLEYGPLQAETLLFSSAELAMEAAAQYVTERWPVYMGDKPLPTDRAELVNAFFDQAPGHHSMEFLGKRIDDPNTATLISLIPEGPKT